MRSVGFGLLGAIVSTLIAAFGTPPVEAQHQISGQIRYYGSNVAVDGVSVHLFGPTPATTVTGSGGQYSFTNLPDGNWRIEPSRLGDGTQSVTAIDAAVELQATTNLITPTTDQRLACDANGSGTLTAIDATLILRYRVALIPQLPVGEGCGSDWIFVPSPAPAANQTPIGPTPNPTPTVCVRGSIAFEPLAGDATNQDFIAVLAGDCNGNWPNPTPPPPPTASSTPTPSIVVPWPTMTFAPTVYAGLSMPTYVTGADNNDGHTRILVVLQDGLIRLIKDGVLQTTPMLNIGSTGSHNRISCCGERGLLSVALPPGYAAKRYFYVNYTNTAGNTVVARYHLDALDNDVADVNSEEILLTVTQPFANHNGGQLQFGPDGYLYIGMGDGGDANDPLNNAQNSTSLLGKLLRIDVEGPLITPTPLAQTTPTPYFVPASNPSPNATVTQTPGYRSEIWALGLRNPWRFSFDRLTGDLYIGDVGQAAWEEVDFQAASSAGGENYGWRLWEGNHETINCGTCTSAGFTFPVVEYAHGSGDCSITGGYVYRGNAFPCMHGTYFYADFCSGRIWGLRHEGSLWQNQLLIDAPFNITTFGQDVAGNLYIGDSTNGRILQLQDACVAATLTPTRSPTPTPTPTPP